MQSIPIRQRPIPPTANISEQIMSAQMSQVNTQDIGSLTAGREDRTPSPTPFELAPDTQAASTETDALVDNEAHIKPLEAGHEELDSEGSLILSPTPATSGWKPSSSFATTYDSTPTSPSGSSRPLSGTAHADDSGIGSEFTSPSISALFPGPLKTSESTTPGDVARSRGLKRSLQESGSSDEDDEPPTKHKRARASGAFPSQDDFVPSDSPLFPTPVDRAVSKSLEVSESAFTGNAARSQCLEKSGATDESTDEEEEPPTKHRGARSFKASPSQDDVTRSQGLEEPSEASNSAGEDDEPPTKHRSARSAGAFISQDDVATPSAHTSRTRKRSHLSMAGEEDDDEDELLSRKKIAKTTAYVDLTESDDEATPRNIVDLTGSERGSSPAPSPKVQESYLHRLPGELRNRIYRHIGLIGCRLELRNFEEPALAVAIPDLKDELISFMLSANKVRVPIYSGFRTDLKPGAVEKKSSKKSPKKDGLGDFNNSHTAPGQVGIAPDSWVMQVDPRYVTIKHICLRVLESHVSESGHKHLCDYFLNVSCKDGQMRATGRVIMETSDVLKRTINHMACLATARANQRAQKEGFEGFTWEQIKYIAASFVSVADARSRYTKKSARVTLLEGLN